MAGALLLVDLPEREWSARSIYLTELHSQSPDCAETDTLYLRITEPVGALEGGEWGVRIWPNPTSGLLFIERPVGSPWQAYLYNLQGQLVRTWELSEPLSVCDLSDLPAGLYRLHGVGPQGLLSWPLLLQP